MRLWLYIILVNWFKLWAKLKLKLWRPKIIGITGSIGKTSLLHILDAVLRVSEIGHRSSFKANSEIGLPLDILRLKPPTGLSGWLKLVIRAPLKAFYHEKADWYVAEMGIDSLKYPYNMDFLLSIFVPNIAICLEVSLMHALQFGSEAGVDKENQVLEVIAGQKTKMLKASLIRGGWIIYNQDNPYIKKEMSVFLDQHPHYRSRALSLSMINPKADIFIKAKLDGFDFKVELDYNNLHYRFSLPGLALFVEYARLIGSAIVTALRLGVKESQIQAGLRRFNLPGRLSLLEGIKETLILDSSYNAPYQAMVKMLNHFYHLFPDREKILVLGEMRELGVLSQKKHQELAKMVAGLEYKHLLLIGSDMERFFIPHLNKLKPKASFEFFDTSPKLGQRLRELIEGKEAIFFKGSQNTIFLEEAIKKILKNPTDKAKLVRQSSLWQKRKAAFFRSRSGTEKPLRERKKILR